MEEEQQIRAFLASRFPGFDEGCEADADLSTVIDSLGLFDLLEFIERDLGVHVPTSEFSPQKFSSISRMLEFFEELRSQ